VLVPWSRLLAAAEGGTLAERCLSAAAACLDLDLDAAAALEGMWCELQGNKTSKLLPGCGLMPGPPPPSAPARLTGMGMAPAGGPPTPATATGMPPN